MRWLICFLSLILLTACYANQQQKIVDPQLGYSVVFPARVLAFPWTSVKEHVLVTDWSPNRTTQSTPFGEITWFSRIYLVPGRLDQTYIVEVGNLPPGNQGGVTQDEIIATMKEWNSSRFPGQIADLDSEHGPGFVYSHQISGVTTEGTVIFRRGRIHHARGSSPKPNDPLLINFLGSFRVDP